MCSLAGKGDPLWRWDGLNDRLVSPMGSQLLLRRHCDIESAPCLRIYCTVLFRYPIYFVPHKGVVGMASLYWIGPLFKFLWVMVRCRDVFSPVWEARCGGETVWMTVLSPQWNLQCCCVGIFGLWFDVEMYSCRYGGARCGDEPILMAVLSASLYWIVPLFKNIFHFSISMFLWYVMVSLVSDSM